MRLMFQRNRKGFKNGRSGTIFGNVTVTCYDDSHHKCKVTSASISVLVLEVYPVYTRVFRVYLEHLNIAK